MAKYAPGEDVGPAQVCVIRFDKRVTPFIWVSGSPSKWITPLMIFSGVVNMGKTGVPPDIAGPNSSDLLSVWLFALAPSGP